MSDLDHRPNAYRTDLADEKLRGRVDAKRFVAGVTRRVTSHFADILKTPHDNAPLDRQILHGETVTMFDEAGGFAWVKRDWDGYVGYVAASTLGDTADAPTHLVSAPRTFLYPEPDLQAPRCGYRSMGSRLRVTGEAETRGTRYGLLDTGEAIILSHVTAVGQPAADYVAVAEKLLYTPYLWGGNTGFGLDCSGLTQLSMLMTGRAVPGDSDMQFDTVGEPLEAKPDFSNLRRGDLVFWKGHMGIMADGKNLLHANGNTMNVAIEPLKEAVTRIAYLYDEPTGFRRP